MKRYFNRFIKNYKGKLSFSSFCVGKNQFSYCEVFSCECLLYFYTELHFCYFWPPNLLRFFLKTRCCLQHRLNVLSINSILTWSLETMSDPTIYKLNPVRLLSTTFQMPTANSRSPEDIQLPSDLAALSSDLINSQNSGKCFLTFTSWLKGIKHTDE